MKKIFRMALVFALAGATLMYTGCTKDYSEDINKLDKELTSLEGKYQDLLTQLNDAKSSLEAAYKAADKVLEGNFDTKIAEINAAIAKKADQAAVDASIDQLKKDLMAEAEKLEKANEALKKEVKDLLDEFYATMSGEIRALVFVPDFYYAGIEATEYSYANFATYKMTALEKATKSEANNEVTYNKGAKTGASTPGTYKDKDNKDVPFTYTEGSVGIVTYDMNPSSFDVEEAEWSLIGMDRDYVALKGEEPKVWTPKFYSAKAVEGNAEIGYKIENYDLVRYQIADDASEQAIVPVIQATAALKDGKTVSSDWNAILLAEDVLKDLAFTKASDWTTTYTHQGCPLSADPKKDLYASADAALVAVPSVEAVYNGGSIDLGKDVAIHMDNGVTGAREEISLADFVKNYPGFKFNFELVSYTIGANKTAEDAYGTITSEGVFTPCYVDEKGNSVVIAKDAEAGISAVGRAPMVLVQLVEPAHGLTVNWGYFRIVITEKEPELNIKAIDVKDFGTLPYLCNTTLNFKWYEFSAKVLEALKIKYQQFLDVYSIEEADGPKKLVQGQTYTPQIYVKNGEKYEIAYKLGQDGKPTQEKLALGTITYTVDATGEGVNDAFAWTFDKAAADNLKKYDALYILFQENAYNKVAFKISYKIAAPAEITYGEINPSYWFKDVEADVQNTVRANVLVPNKTTDDVTKFVKKLNDYFVGNQVKVVLKDESKEVYGEAWKTMTTAYSYKFAAAQPVINGVPFVANESGTVIYVATYDDTKKEYTKDNKGNYIADKSKPIASLTAGGSLEYQTNDTAKEFLNLWGITETEVEKMLYVNVQVDYSAGDCKIAEGTDVFHVRFVRPLTITSGEGGKLKDAEPAGSEIALGYLFNAIDWNGLNEKPLFSWHAKTDKEKFEGFVANTYKGIVWYEYYGISKIKVDCANALTNQTGEWGKLSEINKAAKLQLYGASGPDSDNTASNVAYVENANKVIDALSTFKLHYENNMGETEDFALRIPIEVTYKWGTIKVEVEIPVQGTKNK